VRYRKYIFASLVIAALVAVCTLHRPATKGAVVSVSVRGFGPNSEGQRCAMIVVSNASRQEFSVALQAQTNGPTGWVSVGQTGVYEADPENWNVRPFSHAEFRIPFSPPTVRWRVEALCYPVVSGPLKLLRWLEQVPYLLRHGGPPEYKFRSPEMPPNQVTSLDAAIGFLMSC
jgi:hypothetical protein